MSHRHGKYNKVTLGSDTVVGMGTFSVNGIQTDQADTTAFGDNWKTFEFGAKDGGTLSFSGLSDPDDQTGQEELQVAQINNSDIYNIRFYIDNTSYLTPCATTGYFSPFNTTGMETRKSWVNITSYNISSDKADMMKVSFDAKISGLMVLV